MVQLVVFVNLFFVPTVALWFYNKRRGVEFIPTLKLLMEYAILVSFNVPLTKVLVFLARKLLHRDISIDSGYYTLLAIMAAGILPVLHDWLWSACADRGVLLQKGKAFLTKREMPYKQKLSISLLLVAMIVIAYIIRGPLEIYAGNTQDLEFRLFDFFHWLLVIGVMLLAVAGLLLALLSDVPFCICSILLLWFGVSSWIQDMFLNTKLSEPNGGVMDWNSLGSMPQNNFLIWLMLLAVAVLLYVRFKKNWRFIVMGVAGGLCIVQIIAICAVFFALPEKQAGIYNAMGRDLSAEKQMQMASEDNFIILCFDTAATDDVASMLEEYPEAGEIMKDFIYFDDVCSDYASTFPSVSHFLTGNDLVYDTSSSAWLRDSWQSERCNRFFQILQDAGYERRFYTSDANTWVYGGVDNLEGKADNIVQQEYKVSTGSLLKRLLKTSVYRFLPYQWKQPFEVLTSEFRGLSTPQEFPAISGENLDFYQKLTSERLSVDPELKKLFSYTHLYGAHYPRQHDKELNFKEEATDAEIMRGLFKILEEYFNQMKALGIYDDATIIVMSDHGNWRNESWVPMFFMKHANETHEHMETNSAPVRYQDFQATILELIEENDGSFGTSFFDWQAGQKRSRTYCSLSYDSNWPPLTNGFWQSNVYYIWTYSTDSEELRANIQREPDQIERANTWP